MSIQYHHAVISFYAISAYQYSDGSNYEALQLFIEMNESVEVRESLRSMVELGYGMHKEGANLSKLVGFGPWDEDYEWDTDTFFAELHRAYNAIPEYMKSKANEVLLDAAQTMYEEFDDEIPEWLEQ